MCDAVAGCAVVECAVVGRAVVGRDVVGCAVVGRDAGNLYPKQGKSAKWVEKPISACRESLPKTGKVGEMGRETKFRLPGIST